MNDIEKMCRDHFNEPVLVGFELGRVIGYGEDDLDAYLIVKYPRFVFDKSKSGEICWHTAVGGYIFLDSLKNVGITIPNHPTYEGEVWNDFTRLDNFLDLNGCPKHDEFVKEINE